MLIFGASWSPVAGTEESPIQLHIEHLGQNVHSMGKPLGETENFSAELMSSYQLSFTIQQIKTSINFEDTSFHYTFQEPPSPYNKARFYLTKPHTVEKSNDKNKNINTKRLKYIYSRVCECVLCHGQFTPKISSPFTYLRSALYPPGTWLRVGGRWKKRKAGHQDAVMAARHHSGPSHLTGQAENTLASQTEDHPLPSSFGIKRFLQKKLFTALSAKSARTVNQRDKTAFSEYL